MSCWKKFLNAAVALLQIGTNIWWIVDGIFRLDDFGKINHWLGPWNITLAIQCALAPTFFTQGTDKCLQDDPECSTFEWGQRFLRVAQFLDIGLLFCVGLFYWQIPTYWSQILLQYRIAWIVVIVPVHVYLALTLFFLCRELKSGGLLRCD